MPGFETRTICFRVGGSGERYVAAQKRANEDDPTALRHHARGRARGGDRAHDVDLPLTIEIDRVDIGIVDRLALHGDRRIVD